MTRLIARTDDALRLKVFHVIGEFGARIVGAFYEQLRSVPEIADFFDHDVVEDRLSWVMRLWLTELFFYPRESDDVEQLVIRQIEVGKRHSLINVPLTGMQLAVAEMKRGLFERLINTGMEPARLTEAILYVNEMVDWAVGIINRTCIRDMLADVRDQQILKLQIFNVDMALQTESLRSSLYDWHRQVLRLLYDDGVGIDCFPALRRTNLGLWILHKGDLMLPDTVEIGQLKHIVERIDGYVRQAVRSREEVPPRELRAALTVIDQYVNSAAAILSTISDRMLTLEGGRDPLTKLFNRRFLRTILQREVKLSNSSGDRFAAIMVDSPLFRSKPPPSGGKGFSPRS
ncbi:MAG: protoglobin domain-containing protein [Rhodospirillaceae bacterium]